MKALTLTEPYASLIARGVKRIETRDWSTRYRGPVAIHAAAGFSPLRKLGYPGTLAGMQSFVLTHPALHEACKAASDGPGGPLVGAHSITGPGRPEVCPDVFPLPFTLTLGKILAVAELVGCVEITRKLAIEVDRHEFHSGDFTPGRFAWILENVRQVKPLSPRDKDGRHPFAPGLWTVPPEIAAQLSAASPTSQETPHP